MPLCGVYGIGRLETKSLIRLAAALLLVALMLPFTDLPELSRGFYLELEDGIMLVTAFTFPVELYSSDGSLLAEARWVGIQWDRDEDKPNRLLYGGSPYEVEGAVSIDGDMGELLQVIQPVIDELP